MGNSILFSKNPSSRCVSDEGNVLREGDREQNKQAGGCESLGISLGEASHFLRKHLASLVLGKDRCNASCSDTTYTANVSGRSGDGPVGTLPRVGWPGWSYPVCRAKEIWDNILPLNKPRVSAWDTSIHSWSPSAFPTSSWSKFISSVCELLLVYIFLHNF